MKSRYFKEYFCSFSCKLYYFYILGVSHLNRGCTIHKLLLNEPRLFHQQCVFGENYTTVYPYNKVHGANMGPTWVLSAPHGPHVGPMDLAIRDTFLLMSFAKALFFTKKKMGCSGYYHSVFRNFCLTKETFGLKFLKIKKSRLRL